MHPEIQRARDILARRADQEAEFEAYNATRDPYVPLERTPPLQQSGTTMTPNWDDDWNQWAESHVQRGLERAAEVLGSEVAEIERALIDRIEKVETELAQMRSEREIVERVAAEVIDLPDFRKKHNAT